MVKDDRTSTDHFPGLAQHLPHYYSILAHADLQRCLDQPHGLKRFFAKHHRTRFDHDQRLVLYAQGVPDRKTLTAIKAAADFIDISCSFILLLVPQDIADTVLDVCGPEDHFDCVIYQGKIDRVISCKDIPDTVCPILWSQIEIWENGRCHPCCLNNTDLGSIKTHDLSEMIVGTEMTKVRQDMLTGQRAASCQACWSNEDHGLPSMRQQVLQYYKLDFFARWIDRPAVRLLDMKCGNTCNAKCRICGPWRSSLHAQEYVKYADQEQGSKLLWELRDHRWFDDDNQHIRKQFKDLLPDLVNINIYGGEPFYVNDLDRFLDWICQEGHADHIRLHFNTNGSIFPETWIDTLSRFKEVDIGFSIDDVGRRFEVQRTLDWDTVNDRIDRFMRLDPDQFQLSVWPTVSILNVLYLDELEQWAQTKGLLTPVTQPRINIGILENPWYFSIEHMTPAARDLVCDKLSRSEFLAHRNLVNRIMQGPGSDGKDFCLQMLQYDQRRSEDFAAAHPEISRAMGLI